MKNIKYTKEQRKELKKMPYVKNCTSGHIVFTKEFKEKVVKLDQKYKSENKYISAKGVFMHFGFPEYVIESDTPSNSLARWKNLAKRGIVEDIKGRPRKNKK